MILRGCGICFLCGYMWVLCCVFCKVVRICGMMIVVMVRVIMLMVIGFLNIMFRLFLLMVLVWISVFFSRGLRMSFSMNGVIGRLIFFIRQLISLNMNISYMLNRLLFIEQVLISEVSRMIGQRYLYGICSICVNIGVSGRFSMSSRMLLMKNDISSFQMSVGWVLNSSGLGCSLKIVNVLRSIVVVVLLGILSVRVGMKLVFVVVLLVFFGFVMFLIVFWLKLL